MNCGQEATITIEESYIYDIIIERVVVATYTDIVAQYYVMKGFHRGNV